MKLILTKSDESKKTATEGYLRLGNDYNYSVGLGSDGRRIDLGNDKTLFIEGEIYYYLDASGGIHTLSIDEDNSLASIFSLNGTKSLNNIIEGVFSYIILDNKNKTAVICADKFNRKDIFYKKTPAGYIFSTDINDLIENGKIDYNRFAVACLLSINYTPSRHTIYDGIFKVGVSEAIKLEVVGDKLDLSASTFKDIRKISTDKDEDFIRFYGLFKNAVLSRSSSKENYVQLSGGIDSTIILDCLLKEYDSVNVKAVCAKTLDSKGRWLNYADVNRPILIAKHYGIKLELVEQRLDKEYNIEYWNLSRKRMKNEFMFNSLHYRMAERLKAIVGIDTAILNGEASDSLFNFGFTQRYVYDSPKIKSYLEKMRSYFYGPGFFDKIKNKSAEENIFLKIFQHYRKGKYILSEKKDIFEYIFSFIFSEERLPFAESFALNSVLTAQGLARFKEWVDSNYFRDILGAMTRENIYSCLINLYLNFHLQGANIKSVLYAMRENGLKIRMPFLDLLIVDYLSCMPQRYGRGLEFRPVKYPLYSIAKRIPRFPIKIIRNISGEINYTHTRGDLFKNWLFNSSLTPRLKQLCDPGVFARSMGHGFFDINKISKILENFPNNDSGHELLFRLLWILELME